MLHYNLNKEAAQVALLQDEIKHLENYVYIQRVRYGDAFSVHLCIPPELGKHKVLRFMLQPIVENSLLHGFVGPRNGYQLSIDAILENGKLVILVTDNGAGLSPDDLDALTQAFRNPGQYDVTQQQGIGLRNVNTRIKLTFGSEYGLAITSQPGVKTQVRITLPVLGEEGEWDVPLAGD